jgi:hypothetical protein
MSKIIDRKYSKLKFIDSRSFKAVLGIGIELPRACASMILDELLIIKELLELSWRVKKLDLSTSAFNSRELCYLLFSAGREEELDDSVGDLE